METFNFKLPDGWIVGKSNTYRNRPYYYNTRTGVSVWHLEDVFKQPTNAVKKKRSDCSSESSCASASGSSKSPEVQIGTPSNSVLSTVLQDRIAMNNTGSRMEVDDSPEVDDLPEVEKMEIVEELEELRRTIARDMNNVTGQLAAFINSNERRHKSLDPAAEPTLYVVVDTNILLSSLKTITVATSFKSDEFNVIIVIPWVVLQELDVLKNDNYSDRIAKRAQAANRFLRDMLSSPKSNFLGQTVFEAAEESFQAKSCDDRILQCCLQFRKRSNSVVALLSNDINLSNKAVVNLIYSLSSDTVNIFGMNLLLNELKSKKKEIQKILPKTIKCNTDEKWCNREVPCTVTEIYDNFKTALLDSLSVMLQEEMEKVYKVEWQSIILIKPPWTLVDILRCLEKHWIAVFGFLIKRSLAEDVKYLRIFFTNDEGKCFQQKELQQTIERALKLLLNIQHHSDYNGTVNKSIKILSNLDNLCSQLDSETCDNLPTMSYSQNSLTPSPKDMLQNHTLSPVAKDETMMTEQLNYQPMISLLRNTWEKLNNYCGMLCDCLEVPHNISYDRLPNLPTKEEALRCLGLLFPIVEKIWKVMDRMFSDPENSWVDKKIITRLFDAVIAFALTFNESEVSEEANPDMLYCFCQEVENKERLRQAHQQLTCYRDLLYNL